LKILVTGAGGFVGKQMTGFFSAQGHEVTGVDRNRPDGGSGSALGWIQADTMQKGAWQDAVAAADVVINLAGKNIFGRWTEKTKTAILESRVRTTENVVEALLENRRAVLLSTSAVGYYGNRGDDRLDESEPAGDDFLSRVCIAWEEKANRAVEKGIRVVNMRFGLVMGKNGGALKTMLPAYKAFVGGPLGSGKHFMPWIHMDDLISAHAFVIDNPEISGPINCCSPGSVRNEAFAKTLGTVLGRPTIFRVPRFALAIVMGELGDMVLSSQRAVPEKLLAHGFIFAFPELQGALEDLLLS
jgi:uncharacterized protein